MTRLPLISSKQMEKMLFQLGFEKVRQKEVMPFTGIRMDEQQLYPIIPGE